jgi:ElaB/YqjD/DUF883 family membrane-anchored ribosome-binding protein
MAQSSDIWTELLAMKAEITHKLGAQADEVRTASQAHVTAFAEQIKGIADDLGDTLKDEERRLEEIVAARPIAALATAFALGLAVGLSTRTLR